VGPQGPSGITTINVFTSMSGVGQTTRSWTATCPTNTRLIGGGGNIIPAGEASIGASYPNGSSWTVTGFDNPDSGGGWQIQVMAICVTP
jgi:hypothetical protein